jgi:hypothetical protein
MHMKALRIFAFAIALVAISTAPGFAADPIGIWNTEQGTVRVSDCGGALCASIASLKQPADPQTGRPKTDTHNPDASKRN